MTWGKGGGDGGLTQWLASTAIFSAVGGWTFVALHTLQQALDTAEQEITRRQRVEEELRQKNEELSAALEHVKTLSGMLPICSGCKKIRDDKNYWHQVENYISDHTDAVFTHSYCPSCARKYFPDFPPPPSGTTS